MATSRRNAKSPTIRRILREAQELAASPSADIAAAPLESDLFEWHFTLRGPPNSVYADGIYHGRIVLPPTYPLRPPSFRFVTPSGRFEANREICLSISGHHEETWQPAWGLRTALVALRSFMETDPRGQVGGVDASDAVRRKLAGESGAFVCTGCGGRSNAAILAESAAEEAAAAGGNDGSKEKEADVVPPELKLVFRDELPTKTAPSANADASPALYTSTAPTLTNTPATPSEDESRFPHPPRAPVVPAHAIPAPPPTPLSGSEGSESEEQSPAVTPAVTPAPHLTIAAPGTATGVDTPTTPLTPRRPPQTQAQIQRRVRPNSDEAVPVWVDRMIVVLCVVLGAMLIRLIFG